MNWQAVKNLTHVQVGVFLALLIIAVSPNFGLKHGVSPLLPAGLLALLGGWLLWNRRTDLFVHSSVRRLSLVFALLFVPVLISIPASYDRPYSMGVAGALLAYYFTGIALVQVLRGDAEREWFTKWALIVLGFWLVDSMIQFALGRDLFGIPVTPDGRVLGPFKDTLRQPTFIALLLPIGLWFLMRRNIVSAVIFFAFAGFVAMLGGVRMVLVMLVVVAAGLYIKLPRWRWKLPVLLLAGVVVTAAMSMTPAMQDRIKKMGETRGTLFETLDHQLSNRLYIWDTATNMLQARPLTGVGAGAFAKAYHDYSTRPGDMFREGGQKVYHAHQVYFALAGETGLPGLLGLIAAIVLGIKWYRAASPERRHQAWPYALGLMVYLFPFNTQPPMYNGNWLFPILLLLLAACLAALDERPETGNNPREEGHHSPSGT